MQEQKFIRKEERGITLIALVVTIIVLLILATVSIVTLTGNNGILSQSETAREETRGASVQEARDLWKINHEGDNYTENGTAQTLEELINDLVDQNLLTEDEKDQILGNELKGIKSTGQVTIGSRRIVFGAQPTVGEFIKYDVSYIDAYYSTYNYSNTNGWRLLSYTNNGDGTYSDIELISTGVPAKLYFHYSNSTYNSWHIKDEIQLTNFRELLGDDFGVGGNTGAWRGSAGLYYNFGDIMFKYGTTTNANQGYFTSITNGSTTYDSNNAIYTNGNELFITGNASSVRCLTLPEVNEAIGRGYTDSKVAISVSEDPKGLYRLDRLQNVAEMSSYNYNSTSNNYYWLASPYPPLSSNQGWLSLISTSNGGIGYGRYDICGVRPVVNLESDIEFELSEDGTYYIMK